MVVVVVVASDSCRKNAKVNWSDIVRFSIENPSLDSRNLYMRLTHYIYDYACKFMTNHNILKVIISGSNRVLAVSHFCLLQEDFNSQLSKAGSLLVVVDFHATWCGPCKFIAPKLEEFASTYASKIVVLKVRDRLLSARRR